MWISYNTTCSQAVCTSLIFFWLWERFFFGKMLYEKKKIGMHVYLGIVVMTVERRQGLLMLLLSCIARGEKCFCLLPHFWYSQKYLHIRSQNTFSFSLLHPFFYLKAFHFLPFLSSQKTSWSAKVLETISEKKSWKSSWQLGLSTRL